VLILSFSGVLQICFLKIYTALSLETVHSQTFVPVLVLMRPTIFLGELKPE
jgi:hypothetical protein